MSAMAGLVMILGALRRHRRELPVLVEAAVWLAAARLIRILLEFRRVAKLVTGTLALDEFSFGKQRDGDPHRLGHAHRRVARPMARDVLRAGQMKSNLKARVDAAAGTEPAAFRWRQRNSSVRSI
jgi:hypothetical protein